MTDNRKSGLALIVGSAGMLITMAVHPGGMISPAAVESMARKLTAVHSLALLTLPLLLLGALGLSHWLKAPDRLAIAAFVLYALAIVAVMQAAVADGLVAPNVLRRLVEASTDARANWQIVFRYNFEVNQAYARLYAVASSLAVALWSILLLRPATRARGAAIFGFVITAVTILAVASGKLSLDVHGFGAVVLGQAIWFVAVGLRLWDTPQRSAPPPPVLSAYAISA